MLKVLYRKTRGDFFISTVASLLVAALLGNKSNPYKGHLPEAAEILWFDTEQSRTHCYKTGARIGKLVLGEENLHPKVTMLLIREYSSLVKWQFIQNAVNLNRNVKVIVIDNLADLVASILDEQEASGLLTGLLRLAEMNSLLVIGILHTNKANKNSRGHVGSLAEQRAETVISVEKSGRRIKIEGSLTRNGPFPTVWYERKQDQIEFFFEHESKSENTFKRNFDNTSLEVHKQVLAVIFREEQQLFPRDFKGKLKKEYELKVHKIGLELVKLLQSYMSRKNLSIKSDQNCRWHDLPISMLAGHP